MVALLYMSWECGDEGYEPLSRSQPYRTPCLLPLPRCGTTDGLQLGFVSNQGSHNAQPMAF